MFNFPIKIGVFPSECIYKVIKSNLKSHRHIGDLFSEKEMCFLQNRIKVIVDKLYMRQCLSYLN